MDMIVLPELFSERVGLSHTLNSDTRTALSQDAGYGLILPPPAVYARGAGSYDMKRLCGAQTHPGPLPVSPPTNFDTLLLSEDHCTLIAAAIRWNCAHTY